MSSTFEASDAVYRAYRKLPASQRRAFHDARKLLIAGLREDPPRYHPSLRVERHQSSGPAVYELSFGDGGRARLRHGQEIRPGDPHIEWVAVGDHKTVE